MSVAIVDYGSGNLHSAQKAFERMARERGLNVPVLVTADPDLVRKADRIVQRRRPANRPALRGTPQRGL